MKDRYRALFTKMEPVVRRNVITLCSVVRSNGCAVVLTGVSAIDVKPTSDDVNCFTEVNGYRCVVRCIEAVSYWLGARDPWTKLDDRRCAARIWRRGFKVVTVLICVLRAV